MRLFVGTKLTFLHGRKLIYRTLCSGGEIRVFDYCHGNMDDLKQH